MFVKNHAVSLLESTHNGHGLSLRRTKEDWEIAEEFVGCFPHQECINKEMHLVGIKMA